MCRPEVNPVVPDVSAVLGSLTPPRSIEVGPEVGRVL